MQKRGSRDTSKVFLPLSLGGAVRRKYRKSDGKAHWIYLTDGPGLTFDGRSEDPDEARFRGSISREGGPPPSAGGVEGRVYDSSVPSADTSNGYDQTGSKSRETEPYVSK